MTPQQALSVLSLPLDASIEDIQEQFRVRAKEVHPDISKASGAAFVTLYEAYRTALQDAKAKGRHRRKIYSAFRIYRLIPRGDVIKVNGNWTVSISIPDWFADAGGTLLVMGTEKPGDTEGRLLPELRFNLAPFSKNLTLHLDKMNPTLFVRLRIESAPQW